MTQPTYILHETDTAQGRPITLHLSERDLALLVHAVDLRAEQLRTQAGQGSKSARPLLEEHTAVAARLNSARLGQQRTTK